MSRASVQTIVSIATFSFAAGCAAPKEPGIEDGLTYGHPCVNAAVATESGVSVYCDVRYVFNGQDLGVTTRRVTIGESRGCQEISAETDVQLDGTTTNLRITLDESTGKVTYHSSADGDVSLSPGFHLDSIWVTTYRPGDNEPVAHEVACPDLDDQVEELAEKRNEPDSCDGGEPDDDGTTTVDFPCPELESYLATNDIYQAMFSGHEAHVGMGHIMVDDIREVAAVEGLASRAQIAGGVGLLFGSLFSLSFQQQNYNITNNFYVGYNEPTNSTTYNY